jgi:cell fate (sporulation/competence/biofilm development) regulator YmcA (YheA/YmcA/DUF963 family)
MAKPLNDRIATLQDLRQRDARIKELKADLDKAEALIAEMRDQVQDHNDIVDRMIESFDMTLNDNGLMAMGRGRRQIQ